ncbi:MAG: GrpB family protein [Acidimicrobiales bacterium]
MRNLRWRASMPRWLRWEKAEQLGLWPSCVTMLTSPATGACRHDGNDAFRRRRTRSERPFRTPPIRAGYVWREHNTEPTKRYFQEQPGARRTHIHVRKAGSLSEQSASLFRDFLRVHPEHARGYAALKHDLAPHLAVDRRRTRRPRSRSSGCWRSDSHSTWTTIRGPGHFAPATVHAMPWS